MAADSSLKPPGPDLLSTTLLVRGLNIINTQLQVSIELHRMLGASNIASISFNRAKDDEHGRHDGIATIRCSNAATYTRWCNKRMVPMLGKLVDFFPHRRSISGSNPTESSKQHDRRPTREILHDAITAMQNETPSGPSLKQIRDSIRDGVESLHNRMQTLGSEVNLQTTTTIEAATTAQQRQHQHLLQQFTLLTTASSDYSKHMSGISTALLAGPLQQAPTRPPGFSRPTQND